MKLSRALATRLAVHDNEYGIWCSQNGSGSPASPAIEILNRNAVPTRTMGHVSRLNASFVVNVLR